MTNFNFFKINQSHVMIIKLNAEAKQKQSPQSIHHHTMIYSGSASMPTSTTGLWSNTQPISTIYAFQLAKQ